MKNLKTVLAGQPNCGKSTIFNLVSGIEQHIANYPGVTVDKKVGFFKYQDYKIQMVDLPGTYSFSSYSLEERVAKEYIINENPDIIINVVDASNLKRNLYLTFQLLEMGLPVIVVLNMMDVAARREIKIDSQKISSMLNCPVVEASGAKGIGGDEIMKSVVSLYENKTNFEEFKINYEELESFILEIEEQIKDSTSNLSKRWLAIKALEGDETIIKYLNDEFPTIKDTLEKQNSLFETRYDKNIVTFLATFRYDSAEIIYQKTVKHENKNQETLTDKADKIVLNRFLALPILFTLMFLVYEISIVMGYKLTDYTWPILASFKNLVIDFMPEASFTDVPMITDFTIWMVNSANALLNYIPIFFILFALIAIMEDVGYMPRMAFILDRVFRKFGLHGQSTLPLVLGGAMVGGCAVPGVMSTKGIADERARMATILTVPYMNCLAKVPFYTLLLAAFFRTDMAIMMFYISTITVFSALIVAKILTTTVLKNRETAPFVMELPPYHLPTLKGVVIRSSQRVWLYIKKVVTIVLAVAIVLFALLQFPGLSDESKVKFENMSNNALSEFDLQIKDSTYYEHINSKEKVSQLLNYYDNYRTKKMINSSDSVDESFIKQNELFYKFIRPLKDKEAKKVNTALKKLSNDRKNILREIKNEKVETSLLGMAGKSIEPLTKYAGFDWKINVAFLSSFAARESAVATLGSLYENNKADNQRAEEAMAQNSGYTPLHASAIIIFMLLTPPCIATMIVVKMQTNSFKWMLFAIFFPIGLGIISSAIIFTLGNMYSWSGFEAMTYYYIVVLLITLILGLYPNKSINWKGGLKNS
ncbi:ferrous iron transport protein B [Aliarcobacter butzleri]|uniref:Ferrous iron transport protein B n=1 Tax=Aliarcobacter butzleri TaxID=28197 RepID=A0AAP4PZ22_9BACT|nr:ferrous iron transport protein B [Aliarcobacter butzleri]MDN5052405.1 ferrous iron transport protein B [Aliarcobacter butzleri]MDN5075443.1 ferrous iron transport protein B [Aliarcobacter butzleri]MDN5117311.1 ferrous iron transport protein B [Aliarcobacter butzleri]MDN5132608.1 ferrous iron transport protein B [Aliarcobacter butzleri]NUW26020.1 ferrous iron transport protein B [Aliarcobacter butzleri]